MELINILQWFNDLDWSSIISGIIGSGISAVVVIDYIASGVIMAVTVLILVMGIRRMVLNDRGWRRMEEDRKAQGKPFYGNIRRLGKGEVWDRGLKL